VSHEFAPIKLQPYGKMSLMEASLSSGPDPGENDGCHVSRRLLFGKR
jgi:hypothetical protein